MGTTVAAAAPATLSADPLSTPAEERGEVIPARPPERRIEPEQPLEPAPGREQRHDHTRIAAPIGQQRQRAVQQSG